MPLFCLHVAFLGPFFVSYRGTGATIEVRHFFPEVSLTWELKDLLPKTHLEEKNKNCYQMKNPIA